MNECCMIVCVLPVPFLWLFEADPEAEGEVFRPPEGDEAIPSTQTDNALKHALRVRRDSGG